MPTFNATIFASVTPAITVTGTNISYAQIKRSLGDYAYLVNRVYLQANDMRQISGVVSYNYLDSSGVQRYVNLTPVRDPYQSQAALYYDVKDFNLVLNGNSQLSFELLPGVLLQVTFYCKRVSKQDKLNEFRPDNFRVLEELIQKPGLFRDWQESI